MEVTLRGAFAGVVMGSNGERKMTSRKVLLCGAASLALTFGLGEVAMAQTLALEEIVVTARKREESLQEVPLAISVFSADDIDRSGFKGLEEAIVQITAISCDPSQPSSIPWQGHRGSTSRYDST